MARHRCDISVACDLNCHSLTLFKTNVIFGKILFMLKKFLVMLGKQILYVLGVFTDIDLLQMQSEDTRSLISVHQLLLLECSRFFYGDQSHFLMQFL